MEAKVVMRKMDYCIIPVAYWHGKSAKREMEVRQWLMDNVEAEYYDAEVWKMAVEDPERRRIWFARERDAISFALRWS